MTDDTESVYITRNRKVYHTDRECPNLVPARRVHKRIHAHVTDLPKCKLCAGADIGGVTRDPMKCVRLLEELDPDDIG